MALFLFYKRLSDINALEIILFAYLFLVPYGLWLVGFKLMSDAEALLCTESADRPNFRPITLVGVLRRARSRSCDTCFASQSLPLFGGILAMLTSYL